VRELDRGRVQLQIADVTGHGLAAAFIGSMTKLAMYAGARDEPHELLEEMNRLMTPHMPEGRFVTMASTVFDPASGALRFSSAGHPPAIVFRRASKEFGELKAKGFAIGFTDDATFAHVESVIERGDVVVLLTDGILEAQNRSGEMYGSDRLGELLKRMPPEATADEITAAALEDLHLFREGRILKDDVTMLVLKRT
jgi:phosphoserine phosphatase RsbU/P